MTAAPGEELALGEQDRGRAQRRYAGSAGLIAAVLSVAGVLLTRHPGGTHAFGVVTFAYGLGASVAAGGPALGREPQRRTK